MKNYSIILLLLIICSGTHCKTFEAASSTPRRTQAQDSAQTNVKDSICTTLFTQSIFDTLAPRAVAPYSYTGFCNAVINWNRNNPIPIFSGETDTEKKNELAAFLGHVLHESHDFQAAREYSQCKTFTTDSVGKVYCKPVGYNGGTYTDPYCSLQHTPTTNPDGCACAPVTESTSMPGYVEADKLFFGRGPLQNSWNYNYKKLSDALRAESVDICAAPDLVATNEEYAWISAFLFWTTSTGAVDTTCGQAVKCEGSFGSTLNVINGGLECPAISGHESTIWERMNDYCAAASALGVEELLSLDGCDGLKDQFDQCVGSGWCPACAVWEDKIGAPSTKEAQEECLSVSAPKQSALSAPKHGRPSSSSYSTQIGMTVLASSLVLLSYLM